MPRNLPARRVDPSIIRELSGIYKPFVKALKELVSNAYDADAENLRITIANDCGAFEITDDGMGMTPFEFWDEFIRIGGSYKRNRTEPTVKGRLRIGSKGIGFLAVARYCGAIDIVSTSRRRHRMKFRRKISEQSIQFRPEFGLPISATLLSSRLKVTSVALISEGKKRQLNRGEYEVSPNGGVLLALHNRERRRADEVEIQCSVDCRDLEFKATIDYDYLLSLENKADLSKLSDFCSIDVHVLPQGDNRIQQQYTSITLSRLKNFVIRDLKAAKKPGRVRNVESESGLDQLIWHLSRCTPVKYDIPPTIVELFDHEHIHLDSGKAIQRVIVHIPDREDVELRRPVWSSNADDEWNTETGAFIKVAIDCEELRARGYILAHRSPIFPAEFRGIAVRVRNVQIGSPTFFGIERILTGASRGMLSQITGEINVLQGLDATDALNPGRDSFYEENPHFKILKQRIIGTGETLSGLLGDIVNRMLERQQVLTSTELTLTRATQYRNALLNLSLAINYYGSNGAINLRGFFASSRAPNGLSHRDDYDTAPGPRIAGFRVVPRRDLQQGHIIDFDAKTIYLDLGHDRWSNRIFLLGEYYDVIPKAGGNNDPLCEIDTITKRVYVNWGHTLRQQMGDSAFLKSAVAWKLSYLACNGDIEAMMDLALKLLTFNGA